MLYVYNIIYINMPTLYFVKYTDWTKDMKYNIPTDSRIDYFTQKEVSDEEFNRLSDDVKTTVNEIKDLINNII